MKLVLVHNHYQQPGGEDAVFAAEAALLEAHGHQVVRYAAHNDSIRRRPALGLARDTIWNRRAAAELRSLVRRQRAQVVHFHNTFPLISPAAYYAARETGAAVVQTLHNFRLLCPQATFLRNGRVCEDCLRRRVPWPAVLHACYRRSRPASAVVAAMLAAHRAWETWTEAVDVYIALTEFSRCKFVEGDLPAEKIVVKPNFMHPDPGPGPGRGGYAVFVGRLSPEKGIETLLSAWSQLPESLPLKIVGDGPLAARVCQAAADDARITWLGWRPLEEVAAIVGDAVCLVIPSIWYEAFPRTLAEAFAAGTPVVASHLGAMAELVDDGRTGLHFEPGNPGDLALKVRQLLADPARLAQMRQAARRQYQQKYSAEANYRQLMAIYQQAACCAARQLVPTPQWSRGAI